jgi:hypothetical protein
LHGLPDVPVRIIYIPGNHDRMANLYPSVKKALAQYLGLTVSPDTVEGDPRREWFFRAGYLDPEHGVLARHGHQFDDWNFADLRDRSMDGHLKVPVGDVLTTEFAVKIPWLLNRLKQSGDYPGLTDEVVRTTRDIDNVRPLSAVMQWIPTTAEERIP